MSFGCPSLVNVDLFVHARSFGEKKVCIVDDRGLDGFQCLHMGSEAKDGAKEE